MGFQAINLVNNRTYWKVFENYRLKYGAEEAEYVWRKAGERYEELISTYQDSSLSYQCEIKSGLLQGIAIYKTILRKHPEEAMQYMEEGVAAVTAERHKKVKKRFAGIIKKRISMVLFILSCLFHYTSERGYVREKTQIDHKLSKIRMTINDCPFRQICITEGVPELLHVFCDMQRAYYFNVPNLVYHRTQDKDEMNNIKSCDIYVGLYQVDKEAKKKKKQEEKNNKKAAWRKKHFYI